MDIAAAEEVARVIDRHDDDDEAAQHVDGRQAIGALIGSCVHGVLPPFRRAYWPLPLFGQMTVA